MKPRICMVEVVCWQQSTKEDIFELSSRESKNKSKQKLALATFQAQENGNPWKFLPNDLTGQEFALSAFKGWSSVWL